MATATEDATTQTVAIEALKHFENKQRDENRNFWCTKDTAPEWVTDMVHACHVDFMPDDYRYQYIVDALDALSENEDADTARDTIEADIYNADLTTWLASNNQRLGFCNDACAECGAQDDIIKMLSLGQLAEKTEVFDLVHSAIEDQADAMNADASHE